MSAIADYLARYGYLALFVLVFVEDLGMPLPGETAVITAGAAAASGALNPLVAWAVATVAAILGDNGAYAIGRYGGRPLLERWGRFVRISPEDIDRAGDFISRYGGPAVFVARFITVVRVVAGLVAGTVRMPWKRFVVWQSAGAVVWAGAMIALGYYGYAPAKHLLVLAETDPLVRLIVGIALVALFTWLALRVAAREDTRHPGQGVGDRRDQGRRS